MPSDGMDRRVPRARVIQSSGVRQTEHKKRRPCTGRRARTRLFRRVFRLFDTRDTKSTTVYTRVHDPQTIGVYRATSTESARFSIHRSSDLDWGGGGVRKDITHGTHTQTAKSRRVFDRRRQEIKSRN